MFKYLFLLSIAAIFYTYWGYPLLMILLTRVKRDIPVKKGNIAPFISLVIAAYNEERNIGAKLREITNLDYPREKIEVFVVSDSSSDRTDEIVKGFADKGINLFRTDKRSGKIAAYRTVLPLLKGEIIVFSDAASLINYKSISKLISNFNDPSVGCAGGFLTYIHPTGANSVGKGEKKYWSYETRIRELESRLSSLPSVSGTLYAVRRNLYPADMKESLADDLIVPLRVKKAGFRTVFEKEAICNDFTTISIKEEIAKRMRITIQNISGLIEEHGILNPFKYGIFSILVISHKLFRILVPVFLLSIFISSLLLSFHYYVFLVLFTLQIFFYLGAAAGYVINKKVKFSLGNTLFYFCLSNLAILKGIIKFFIGERVVTWETVRV